MESTMRTQSYIECEPDAGILSTSKIGQSSPCPSTRHVCIADERSSLGGHCVDLNRGDEEVDNVDTAEGLDSVDSVDSVDEFDSEEKEGSESMSDSNTNGLTTDLTEVELNSNTITNPNGDTHLITDVLPVNAFVNPHTTQLTSQLSSHSLRSLQSTPYYQEFCPGPPSLSSTGGCGRGMWNQAACECTCIAPYCPDEWGSCTESWWCNPNKINPWENCVKGRDCPWWVSPLRGESCMTGPEIPTDTIEIFPTQFHCCNEHFPYSTVCNSLNDKPQLEIYIPPPLPTPPPSPQPTSKPTRYPTISVEEEEYEIIPLKFTARGLPEELKLKEFKLEMVGIVKRILVELSERVGFKVSRVEEVYVGRRLSGLSDMMEIMEGSGRHSRQLARDLDLYYKIYVVNDGEDSINRKWGPIIIKEVRDDYAGIAQGIREYIELEYGPGYSIDGSGSGVNGANGSGNALEFNFCTEGNGGNYQLCSREEKTQAEVFVSDSTSEVVTVKTIEEPTPGLPLWGIVLIVILVLLFTCCLGYGILWGRKKRKEQTEVRNNVYLHKSLEEEEQRMRRGPPRGPPRNAPNAPPPRRPPPKSQTMSVATFSDAVKSGVLRKDTNETAVLSLSDNSDPDHEDPHQPWVYAVPQQSAVSVMTGMTDFDDYSVSQSTIATKTLGSFLTGITGRSGRSSRPDPSVYFGRRAKNDPSVVLQIGNGPNNEGGPDPSISGRSGRSGNGGPDPSVYFGGEGEEPDPSIYLPNEGEDPSIYYDNGEDPSVYSKISRRSGRSHRRGPKKEPSVYVEDLDDDPSIWNQQPEGYVNRGKSLYMGTIDEELNAGQSVHSGYSRRSRQSAHSAHSGGRSVHSRHSAHSAHSAHSGGHSQQSSHTSQRSQRGRSRSKRDQRDPSMISHQPNVAAAAAAASHDEETYYSIASNYSNPTYVEGEYGDHDIDDADGMGEQDVDVSIRSRNSRGSRGSRHSSGMSRRQQREPSYHQPMDNHQDYSSLSQGSTPTYYSESSHSCRTEHPPEDEDYEQAHGGIGGSHGSGSKARSKSSGKSSKKSKKKKLKKKHSDGSGVGASQSWNGQPHYGRQYSSGGVVSTDGLLSSWGDGDYWEDSRRSC